MNLLPQLSTTLRPSQAKLRTSFTDTLHFRKITSMVTKRFAGNFFQSSSCNFGGQERHPHFPKPQSKLQTREKRLKPEHRPSLTNRLSFERGLQPPPLHALNVTSNSSRLSSRPASLHAMLVCGTSTRGVVGWRRRERERERQGGREITKRVHNKAGR